MSTTQPRVGPQYATVQQFKDFVGQAGAGDALDDHFMWLIRSASDTMERKTGRWFNRRSVTFRVHGDPAGSPLLLLPQRIIELTSVEENGKALVEDTDYYRFDSYLEKPDGSVWYTEPFKIVIVGAFGEAAPDDDVAELCCAIAAAEGKYEKRQYINEDGSSTEVVISSYKKWVSDKLEAWAFRKVNGESYRVEYP